jgi:hypothetical protein
MVLCNAFLSMVSLFMMTESVIENLCKYCLNPFYYMQQIIVQDCLNPFYYMQSIVYLQACYINGEQILNISLT